jgi:hypothetical protein
MKEIKDKFVSDYLFYLVLAYLDATNHEPIYKRKLERYEGYPTRPMFSLRWVDYFIFKELVSEAVSYFESKSEDISEETVEKYG